MNNIEDTVKKVLAGGIGAVATVMEKGSEMAKDFVSKEEETIQKSQGTIDSVKEKVKSVFKGIDVKGMTKEERDELRKLLDEADAGDAELDAEAEKAIEDAVAEAEAVVEAVEEKAEEIGEDVGKVSDTVEKAVGDIGEAAGSAVDQFGKIAEQAADVLSDAAGKIDDVMGKISNAFADLFKDDDTKS